MSRFSLQEVARSVEEAAARGSFWSSNTCVPDTVEFWIRTFTCYVEKRHKEKETKDAAKFSEDEIKLYKRFNDFTIKLLAGAKVFDQLPFFVRLWDRIKTVNGEMLGEMSVCLKNMIEAPESISPDTLQLTNFEEKRLFLVSPLWADFLAKRTQA